jgi:UDP-glucose 4-epimerase
MTYRNARVIVLGASGFIGRWIARTIPDDAKTYLAVRDIDSSQKLMTAYNAKGTLIQMDLTNFSDLRKLFFEVQPSIVFNLGGYGVDPTERDSHLMHEINAELPRIVCELIKSHHDRAWTGQNLIHAGTALEYGIAKGILFEDLTPQPTTLYGISKLAGTKTVLSSGLPAMVVRLFNVYGPGEHEGRLLPSLLETARTGKNLALTPGTQKRNFTYVEDVAEGWIRLGLSVSGKSERLVNLATGALQTVREFVETASRVLGIPADRLRFGALPFRKEEMDHQGVSTERLWKLIQWTPSSSIELGIRKTISFLESLSK